LYLGQSGGIFDDATRRSNLRDTGLDMLGFGSQFLDGELDGDQDLVITNGHVDLVTRASGMFDDILVAVASNPGKSPYFSVDERLAMAREALGNLANVAVTSFSNLLVDTAREHGASVIIRGLRAVSDFEYEVQLAGMNRRLSDKVETVFVAASGDYAFLSSSLILEIARLGGDVTRFVPANVNAALQARLRGST